MIICRNAPEHAAGLCRCRIMIASTPGAADTDAVVIVGEQVAETPEDAGELLAASAELIYRQPFRIVEAVVIERL